MKLARLQQSIDKGLLQAPQLPTFASNDLIKAILEAVIKYF